MARISSYPRDLDVVDSDSWIGTSVPGLQTRNFTAAAVAKYLNIKGKISISGPADGSAITAITTMEISGADASGQNTVKFIEYIVGNNILISEQNVIDNFGHFTIDSYTLNGTVYTLNLTNIGGNGNLDLNKFYDFAVFNLSSERDSTFIFEQGQPATTWNIQHNLENFPSITVIDTGDTVVSGEYTYIDNNNVTLTFSAAFAGKAYLN